MALQVGDDAGVSGGFGCPAAVLGVGVQCLDIGELVLQGGCELWSGDVVRAALADVGVGTCFSDEVAGAVAETTRLATTIGTWWPRPRLPAARRHQRAHRGLQPDHQAGQAHRLRLSEHGQLSAAHHEPHRRHQSGVSTSWRDRPRQVRRAPEPGPVVTRPHTALPACPQVTAPVAAGVCPSPAEVRSWVSRSRVTASDRAASGASSASSAVFSPRPTSPATPSCRATNVDYRLDTASARAFLAAFFTLLGQGRVPGRSGGRRDQHLDAGVAQTLDGRVVHLGVDDHVGELRDAAEPVERPVPDLRVVHHEHAPA